MLLNQAQLLQLQMLQQLDPARAALAAAAAVQPHSAQGTPAQQPQLDLGIYRAHMEQQQQQQQSLLLAQAQAQQQQVAQAQAAQQQQSGAVDPREALLRLYSQSSAAASGRGGLAAAQHASMGGAPTSQSSLFNPALLGLQGLSAATPYGKPFAASLQQLSQMKREGTDVIPNGR
ncbi:hypothetical protein NECAME_11583 [Necator americanus]|uniref:Uncharacterized protein n=1 Tax=Necator americanus TaxID=51031 RepID=W2T3U9_NECAM|nr:hypothetical protein NECAME_11583 [Necator americanus]ETN76578.1 hypothetical protein NECAME_11583 [Necator americanus]